MRIEFSSALFASLRTIDTRFQAQHTPLHQAALDAMPQVDWSPVSITASQIVVSRPGGYTLTLAGSGISPVSSLNDLMAAIDAGIATGAFSSLTLRQNGTELARIAIQPSGWTVSSDTLSLALTGAVPTSLQELFAIVEADDLFFQTGNAQPLLNLMNTYALTGLTLREGAEVLFGLSIAAQAMTLQLPGVTGTLTGVFTTRLGDLLQKIGDAQDAAGLFGDWTDILLFEEFQAGALTFRDAAGRVVMAVSEATAAWQEDAYFLLDQQQWVSRGWLDTRWDALIDGTIAFPAATPGNDRITATTGPALVIAGSGNDTVTTGAGDDNIQGNNGDDFVISGAGDDYVEAGSGNDTVWSGAGDDAVWVQSGNNEVWAGTGNDALTGGSGNDTLGGGAGDDYIDGYDGRNQLWGGDGRDTLYAADSGDIAGGGWGDDTVFGAAGDDTLMGGLGKDLIYGVDGNDALYLGLGNDQGYGSAGDDTLFSGAGFDQLWGGAGADRFDFYRAYGWNRLEDFNAADGDIIALGRGMWTGTHGPLTAAQVVQTFGRVTATGDAILDFAAAGTTVVVVGAGTLAGLEDALLIV